MTLWTRRPEDERLVAGLLASQFPGFSAATACVRYLSEGQDFRVFECAGWAWRFPKRAEAELWLMREGPLLEAIYPALGIPVPRFSFHGKPDHGFPFAFAGYRMLRGVAAHQVEEGVGTCPAASVARFLSALHSIPVDIAQGLGVPDGADLFAPDAYLARVRETCDQTVPAGLSASSTSACAVFLSGDVEVPVRPGSELLRLIHGDLEAEHILLDPLTGQIAGVLDWSDACIGDPARDFGALWAWAGESFLAALLAAYSCPLEGDFIRRIKFLGKCFALLDYCEAHSEDEAQLAFCLRQLENVFGGNEKDGYDSGRIHP